MPNVSNGNRFFINDFDNDDMDQLILDVIDGVFDEEYETMEFWINSEGGDAKRAFALVELIELAKVHGMVVETFVLCDAHSAGSMVAVAGSPHNRWVAENASYMIHYGEAEMVAKTLIEAERMGKALVQHFLKVLSHYERYTKIPDLELKLKTDNLYFTGSEAIAMGCADYYLHNYFKD